MSTVSEAMLDAFKIVADRSVAASNAAITIEAEIISVEDAGIGLYTVKFGGNTFNAYASTATSYKPGDIVFVLVPDGDLTKTKTIIGATAPRASMYVTSEPADSYVGVSDNLFVDIDEIELCTYNSSTKNISLDTTSFAMIFQDYLESYRNFSFSARIKTDIDVDQRVNGNYGVILNLPVLEDSVDGTSRNQIWKSVSLDINTMQGDVYGFAEYSLQNIYFEIAEGTDYDTTRDPYITVFVQDFAQNESITAADIWIKDIALKTVDVLTEEDKQGYYLGLVASQGNYFLSDKYPTTKTLIPVLKVNGKNKKVDSYECYWFVEDASINNTSAGYHALGGLGWKCLNKKTNVHYNEEGKQTYQYVTNVYKLTVSQSDVTSTLRYKCVLTKDGIVVGGSVKLKNLNTKIETQLVSATGSNAFVKDTGYVNLIARIYYPGVSTNSSSAITIDTAWQRFDKSDNFIDDNFYEFERVNEQIELADATGTKKTWLETEIKFPCSLLEDLNTVNCTFYGVTTKDGSIVKTNLGTASIIVTTSADFSYLISIQNGDVLYKYDADGDSPMIADYDGPASSKVTEIQPITYRMYKADGTELTETEYLYCRATWKIPKNSMIKLKTAATSSDDDYYYVSAQGQPAINYTILDTYNVKKSDNTIMLTVTFRDNVLTESANIKFLKDGESGTNGSRYAAVITYEGYAYGEKDGNSRTRKLQGVYVNGGGWRRLNCATGDVVTWTNQILGISVYCDGNLLTLYSDYSVEWSMFDSGVTNPAFNVNGSGNSGTISTKLSSWTGQDSCTIVQAKITVGNTGVTNSQEVIYAYYPIELTYLPTSAYAAGVIPNMADGFSEVLYAADGTNPKYDNSNPFSYATNLADVDGSEYYQYVWDASSNLKRPSAYTSSTCAIKPNTKFDNGLSQNFVRVRMTITSSGRTQVNNLISSLSSKSTSLANEANYYQDTLTHLLAFSKIFVYNNYVGMLDKSKDLLNYRTNLLLYIEQLLIVLDNISVYCKGKDIASSIFNYQTICNNIKSSLNVEKNSLYRLGYYTTLDSLNDLTDCKIILSNVDSYKSKYGLGSYEALNGYIEQFNNLLDKYKNDFDILTSKKSGVYLLKSQFDNFKQLETNIIDLPGNANLAWLQLSHYGFGPEQEYLNLKSQLTAVAAKLFDILGSCYSYDTILNEVIKEYQSLIVKYQNSYYETSYTNKRVKCLTDKAEIDVQLTDYKKIITGQTSGTIVHLKPIVMMFNRYELSNINGWDGNKLYVDENNNQYLLAPQVGAGAKKNGRFTGVIMGVKQFNASSLQHIGLFGYDEGIQSYFMNAEDGSVIMGKAGSGQLIADPSSSKALLYSSDFWTNFNNDGKPSSYGTTNWAKKGMLIDLTTPQIQFGSGKFSVNEDGEITAVGGGTIAGWKINDTQIYSNISASNGRLTLDSGATVTGKDAKGNNTYSYSWGKIYAGNHSSLDSTQKGFYLSKEGLSISNDTRSRIELSTDGDPKIFSGSHNTLSSTVKGFYLSQDGLSISNGTRSRIELSTDGDPKIFSNSKSSLTTTNTGFYLANDGLSIGSKVYIDNTGTMRLGNGAVAGTGNHWEVSQKDGNSYIAFGGNTWSEANSDNSDNTKIYLGTNGISLGHRFSVNQNGTLKAYQGEIGGWTITRNKLSAGNIELNSNGSMKGGSGDSEWSISTTGVATFNNILANRGGSIGGWTIGQTTLKGGNITLDSTGSISGGDSFHWSINKAGNATFNHITATDTWSFGSGNNTWSNSGFSYGLGTLGGNVVNGNLAFTNGSMTMGDASKNHVGVAISKDSVKIAGDIYANNGYFKGEIVATSGKIGGWDINDSGIHKDSAYIYPSGISVPGIIVKSLSSLTFATEDIDAKFIKETADDAYKAAGEAKKAADDAKSTADKKADKGTKTVTGTITAPKDGGSCSFSLSVSI